MPTIARALISVSDKTGIVEFARGLTALKVEILSTGGTATLLRSSGLPVTEVATVTGFPEILDGRVKTLHPVIHGGLLGLRDRPAHRRQMEEHGIAPIDLVAVTLYPFEDTTRTPGVTRAEAIENIDIGGPAMIRSAAKNYEGVVVLVDPADYTPVLTEMQTTGGDVSMVTRQALAHKAFARTARYDSLIAAYLGEETFPSHLTLSADKIQELRYGENPHQRAALYGYRAAAGIAQARQIQGKELSFNNIVDADAALGLLQEFSEIAAVVIKHTNPCGVATSPLSLADAFRKARASDPVSIFGGIVGLNREVDEETARAMQDLFLEVILAPAFSHAARRIFAETKKLQNTRLLEIPVTPATGPGGCTVRTIRGGLLLQDPDRRRVHIEECRVVTRRAPTAEEIRALAFAWKVCIHVKSNAIVLASADQVVGVGAGQMSRVDAAKIAVMRARDLSRETRGTVVASDAFFPFRDGLDVCAEAGATAAIQPGGSLRDPEVIAAADEHGMAMVFTGLRHFRH